MKCFCRSPWSDWKISRKELKGLFDGKPQVRDNELDALELEMIAIPKKKLKHKEDKKSKSKSRSNLYTF